MAYLVRIASRAERDLVSLYEHINAPDSAAARQSYQGLKQAILNLKEKPNRCSITPENQRFRHLLYGESHSSTASFTVSISGDSRSMYSTFGTV